MRQSEIIERTLTCNVQFPVQNQQITSTSAVPLVYCTEGIQSELLDDLSIIFGTCLFLFIVSVATDFRANGQATFESTAVLLNVGGNGTFNAKALPSERATGGSDSSLEI